MWQQRCTSANHNLEFATKRFLRFVENQPIVYLVSECSAGINILKFSRQSSINQNFLDSFSLFEFPADSIVEACV